MRVLCVEDDAVTRQALAAFLQALVADVYTAADGREGILAFSKYLPDIVVTDLTMPRMDGMEMIRAIHEINHDVAVVVVSGFDDKEFLHQAIDERVAAYLIKPVDFVLLADTLESCALVQRARRELARQRHANDLMLQAMPYPAMLVDRSSGLVVSANHSAEKMGCTPGAACPGELAPPPGPDNGLASNGGLAPSPARSYTARLGGRVLDVTMAPVAGQVAVLAAVDITQRERMRAELERSNQRLDEAQRTAGMGSFERDLITGEAHWSDQFYRLLGYEPGEFQPSLRMLMRHIHPDDMSVFSESLEAALRDRSQFECEFRVLDKQERERHVLLRAAADWTEGGTPVRYHGSVLDITRRKGMEEALRGEKEFREAIIQNASDGVAVVDRQGRMRFISPGMLEIFGYGADEFSTLEELAGLILDSRQEVERCLELFAQDMDADRPPERVFRFRSMDGLSRWCRVKLAHMPDGNLIVTGQDFTVLKQAEERILHLAMHDTLTGLPNRQLFHDRCMQALAVAQRNRGILAMLYIDLDCFKAINDDHGHDMGDKVLAAVARRLKGCLRESDTVARLGGDEFVVILSDLERPAEAGTVADKIIAGMARPFTLEGLSFTVRASIGISLYPADGADKDGLLGKADKAMYQAKSDGGDCRRYASTPTEAD